MKIDSRKKALLFSCKIILYITIISYAAFLHSNVIIMLYNSNELNNIKTLNFTKKLPFIFSYISRCHVHPIPKPPDKRQVHWLFFAYSISIVYELYSFLNEPQYCRTTQNIVIVRNPSMAL